VHEAGNRLQECGPAHPFSWGSGMQGEVCEERHVPGGGPPGSPDRIRAGSGLGVPCVRQRSPSRFSRHAWRSMMPHGRRWARPPRDPLRGAFVQIRRDTQGGVPCPCRPCVAGRPLPRVVEGAQATGRPPCLQAVRRGGRAGRSARGRGSGGVPAGGCAPSSGGIAREGRAHAVSSACQR